MNGLAPRLLAWHARHGRHDLPWQHPRTAYRVWLSEIMLQQTRVATVIDYFERFVERLPGLADLAAADEDSVLGLWSGLGYYRRARNLHRAAQLCVERHAGRLPRDFEALLALPGIGRSTAGAIMAQAFGEPYPILDGNARRVLARHFAVHGEPGTAAVERQLWALAAEYTPQGDAADYAQAIMDLGATVCSRRKPRCGDCPLAETCMALAQGLTAELPTSRRRKPLPQRAVCMLILRDAAGRVLLQQRDGFGVWPGLWSLPEASDHAAALDLAGRLAIRRGRVRELAPIGHTFSHFRLHIRPLLWERVETGGRVSDNEGLRWHAPEDLVEAGLPAPVRRLLTNLEIA